MTARTFIANTDGDFSKLLDYDKKCGLLTRSNDRTEIIRVAKIVDERHYVYTITSIKRLIDSGIDFKGKEAEMNNRKPIIKKPEKKPRRYEMVFYAGE